jgi:hypothetical protein
MDEMMIGTGMRGIEIEIVIGTETGAIEGIVVDQGDIVVVEADIVDVEEAEEAVGIDIDSIP